MTLLDWVHFISPTNRRDGRFQHLDIIGAFHALGPQAANEDDAVNTQHLLTLSAKFLQKPDNPTLLQEWADYKHLMTGAFKVK